VALSPSDFITPTGRLDANLFPGKALVDIVTAWLDKAQTKAINVEITYRDAATEAYVYYLAYSTVADRLAAEPNSVSIDSAASVSKAIGQDRIQYFARLAQKYLDDFNGYLDLPPKPEKPRSTWVQNKVVF